MRPLPSILILPLLLASAAFAEDGKVDEMKTAMDAFTKSFAGTWVHERKLDNDLFEIGKKGDTLTAHISFMPKDGLVLVAWSAEVNGVPAGTSAKGIVGWDAAQKKLRMRWFTTAGDSGTTLYWQKGNRWLTEAENIQFDGTKGSNQAVFRFPNKNKHVAVVTKRRDGAKKLEDREDTWTRSASTHAKESKVAKSWRKFFVGDWSRQSETDVDGERTTKQTNWTCKPDGAAIIARGEMAEDGTYVAMMAWYGYENSLREVASSTNGANWTINFKPKDNESLRGRATGALADGRTGEGECVITRTGADSYEAVFELTLNDGSKFRVKAVNTRSDRGK